MKLPRPRTCVWLSLLVLMPAVALQAQQFSNFEPKMAGDNYLESGGEDIAPFYGSLEAIRP